MKDLKVEVFTSETCTKCSRVIDNLKELESEMDFELHVIDAIKDRKKALKHGVFSVPTVVITNGDDDKKVLRGVLSREELAEELKNY